MAVLQRRIAKFSAVLTPDEDQDIREVRAALERKLKRTCSKTDVLREGVKVLKNQLGIKS